MGPWPSIWISTASSGGVSMSSRLVIMDGWNWWTIRSFWGRASSTDDPGQPLHHLVDLCGVDRADLLHMELVGLEPPFWV